MSRNQSIRTIHACARSAGLDEDAQRDVYDRLTGKRSLRALSDAQLGVLAGEFKAIAPLKKNGQTWAAAEKRDDLRLILKLWWLLANAGVVAKDAASRRAALNAFIRGRTFREKWGEELTDVRFLSAVRAKDVVEALKAIGKREDVRTIR